MIHPERTRTVQQGREIDGPVVYWMSRDQRIRDNWAMLFARELAERHRRPLVVVFALAPSFLGAALRQYDFMLGGLMELEQGLKRLGIPFFVLCGDPGREVPRFLERMDAGALITDFSPLKIARKWKNDVHRDTSVDFFEVDAHNIVPCRSASAKQEFAARTIRPKINGKLEVFLTPFPELRAQSPEHETESHPVDWKKLFRTLKIDRNVLPVPSTRPGEEAALKALADFLEHRLDTYDTGRNDPNAHMVSGLSPYLHFGHISAQRVALAVRDSAAPQSAREAFLEELVVRRELSENYCFYNERYDSLSGIAPWAHETLDLHRSDAREHLYTRDAFENAETGDRLWNAAQIQIRETGRMHGYMRMYWAKKILEWSPDPETAFETAIYLNDRYALDGRDPNGFTGVAWSIGGVHDRPWFERPVFGKIRYMNYNGCARKFRVDRYIGEQYALLTANREDMQK